MKKTRFNSKIFFLLTLLIFLFFTLVNIVAFFSSSKRISINSDAATKKKTRSTNKTLIDETFLDTNFASSKNKGADNDGLFPFGDKKISVIVVSYKDRPSDITEVKKIASNYNKIIKNFYLENSFNNLNLTTESFGTFMLPINETCDYLETVNQTIKAADKFINYHNFDILEIKTPYRSDCDRRLALHDIFAITTDEGTMNKHIIVSYSEDPELTHTEHEIGHAFGIEHANGWDCQDKSIDYQDKCKRDEYMSHFDLMGRPRKHFHFNAYFKEFLRWIPRNNVKTVTKSGEYSIYPLEKKVNGIQVVKIPIPNTNANYYIENREAIGSDSDMPIEFTKGAIIYLAPDFFDNSIELIDTTPNASDLYSDNAKDFFDAPLSIGKTFFDQINNIKITTKKDEGNLLTVQISIPTGQPEGLIKTFSNLKGVFDCRSADYYFDYPRSFFSMKGYKNDFSIDMSITADFSQGVYGNFAKGTNSPIRSRDNLSEKWDQYREGKVIYWRVRDIDGLTSPIIKTILSKCNKH